MFFMLCFSKQLPPQALTLVEQ